MVTIDPPQAYYFCNDELRNGVLLGRKLTDICLTEDFTLPAPIVKQLACWPVPSADAGLASARAFLYCSNFAMYSACTVDDCLKTSHN